MHEEMKVTDGVWNSTVWEVLSMESRQEQAMRKRDKGTQRAKRKHTRPRDGRISAELRKHAAEAEKQLWGQPS